MWEWLKEEGWFVVIVLLAIIAIACVGIFGFDCDHSDAHVTLIEFAQDEDVLECVKEKELATCVLEYNDSMDDIELGVGVSVKIDARSEEDKAKDVE